jgi:hypothetical protein
MVESINHIKGFVWRNEVTTGTKRLPRPNFALVSQREVRGVPACRQAGITPPLLMAKRFARNGMYLFGTRAPQDAQWQN